MSGSGPESSQLVKSLSSARKLFVPLAVLAALGCGTLFWLDHGSAPLPHSTPLQTPRLGVPAGGSNHSKTMDATVDQQDQTDAQRAAKAGTSYAGEITAGNTLSDDKGVELGDVPGQTKAPSDGRKSGDPKQKANAYVVDPAPKIDVGGQTDAANAGSASTGLPESVELELLRAWAPTPAVVDVQLPLQGRAGSGSGTANSIYAQSPPGSAPQTATATAATTTVGGSESPRRLLMPAGRGIYGHAVLEANSDIGGPVIVEIDSGPLVHDRVSGTFQRQDDRLVITFDKLMIGNSDPISVSAFAVSPDTAETGVASEVNEHYVTRIVLPAAAAFVQGLGNAIQNGNTTSVSSGLGVSSYTKLNLSQQVGVGAGTAAQQLGQILQKATPQEPTVILKRDDPVGVMFAQPVYAP